jgi:hypothetical protein
LNFGKIPNLTLNDAVLIIKKKQEEEADDAPSGYCSLSSLFYPKETIWVPTFQVHFMLHFSIKSNKTCTQMVTCNFSTTSCEQLRMDDNETVPAPT